MYVTRAWQRIRAYQIKATLGVRVAAGYLRNCGWTCEGAYAVLCLR